MEKFYDILLQVNDYSDLISSLRDYTAAELMAGDNKYECGSSVCSGQKQEAHRSVVLRSFPPILTFSFQRFVYDRTSWERVKVTSRFEFPLVLDMSKFLEFSEGVAEPKLEMEEESSYIENLKTAMVWLDDAVDLSEKISRTLLKERGINCNSEQVYHSALIFCSYFLYRSTAMRFTGLDFQLSDLSSTEWRDVRKRLLRPKCTAGIELTESNLYQLHAIIMHRGNAYSGHYFAYIRDCLEEGVWQSPLASSSSTSKDCLSSDDEFEKTLFLEGSNNEVFVRQESVLAIIVNIVQQSEMSVADMVIISKQIRLVTGYTWKDRFKKVYGTLSDFISMVPFFELFGTKCSLNQNKIITFKTNDEFDSILAKRMFALRHQNGVNIAENEPAGCSNSAQLGDMLDPELVQKLASELTAKVYGRFFEFNDSEVKSITLLDTRKAFEGRDSAYLVIYRHANFQDSIDSFAFVQGGNSEYFQQHNCPSKSSSSSLQAVGSSSSHFPSENNSNDYFGNNCDRMSGFGVSSDTSVPSPPDYWCMKARERVERLAQERAQCAPQTAQVSDCDNMI